MNGVAEANSDFKKHLKEVRNVCLTGVIKNNDWDAVPPVCDDC